MKKRKFEDWKFEQIHQEFGYKRHYKNFALLEAWQNSPDPITEAEQQRLEQLQERLFYYVETWNEDELKLLFISQLLELVNFYSDNYKIFTQRKFSATLGTWEVTGVVDFVLAQGLQSPAQPFFFYKQERKRDNDPLGQLLIEMLVAQHLNEGKFPLYGCYIIGRNYFFVVVDGREYAVSPEYDASSSDIMTIFRMFRAVKRFVEAQLGLGG